MRKLPEQERRQRELDGRIRYNDQSRYLGNRIKALDRDEWKCVWCGMTERTHQLQFGRGLNVDHIDGRGRSATQKNHILSNLQTLCCRCHTKKDNPRFRTFIPRLYGDKNPAARLTWNAVRRIRREYAPRRGMYVRLAIRYGVSESTIRHIVKGQAWIVANTQE